MLPPASRPAALVDARVLGPHWLLTKPWNDEELREHILDAFRAHERRAAGESVY